MDFARPFDPIPNLNNWKIFFPNIRGVVIEKDTAGFFGKKQNKVSSLYDPARPANV